MITLTQTGKKYFKNTIYLQKNEKNEDEEEESLASLMKRVEGGSANPVASMMGSNNPDFDLDWETSKKRLLDMINKDAIDLETELNPKSEED